MYKKGTALELQFAPARLNDGAGDPFWIDLTVNEAERLLAALQVRLGNRESGDGSHQGTAAPVVFSLDSGLSPGSDSSAASTREPDPAAAATATASTTAATAAPAFRQWVCLICGWVYDEEMGFPEEGLAPGTRWEDVPDDWRCPLCDVGKADFALVEF